MSAHAEPRPRPAARLRRRRSARPRHDRPDRRAGVGDHALRRVLHGVLLRPLHELPGLSAGAVRDARRLDRHQHGDPGLVLVHDALGARLDQARQPPRPRARAVVHADHGADVPGPADARVHPAARRGLHARARRVRRACSSGSRACTACTCSSARSCWRSPWCARCAATTHRQKHMGVELSGIYWHFVDVVWVVLYTLVYLLSNGARAPL